MDPNNPREAWNRFQKAMQNQTRRGPGGGGPPKGLFGGMAGLALLGGAVFLANNALFNGATASPSSPGITADGDVRSRRRSSCYQVHPSRRRQEGDLQ